MLIAVLIAAPVAAMMLMWMGCGHDVVVYLRYWRKRRAAGQVEIARSVRRHERQQLRRDWRVVMGGK